MISQLITLSLVAVVALGAFPKYIAESVDDCPFNLDRDKYLTTFGSYCFKFYLKSVKTFDEAKKVCEDSNGKLVTVDSKKLNSFITGKLRNQYSLKTTPVWIGLKYNGENEGYKWTDGIATTFTNFGKNGHTAGKDCVKLSPVDGSWSAVDCYQSPGSPTSGTPFVCQYFAFPHPATTLKTISKDGCPVIDENFRTHHHVFQNKCYYINLQESLNFDDAEKACEKNGGTLANVKSKAIENFLQHQLHEEHDLSFFSDSLWIGLRYYPKRGGFFWIDGTLLDYNNFEYDDSTGECVSILPWSGSWEDVHCHDPSTTPKRHFICEYNEKPATAV